MVRYKDRLTDPTDHACLDAVYSRFVHWWMYPMCAVTREYVDDYKHTLVIPGAGAASYMPGAGAIATYMIDVDAPHGGTFVNTHTHITHVIKMITTAYNLHKLGKS